MKSFVYSTALILLLAITALAFTKQRDPMAKSTELIVVTTSDWNSSQATLRRYSRSNRRAHWNAMGEPITVVVGKNGLAWGRGILGANTQLGQPGDPIKKEGDGRAPAGVFRLSKAFGYAPQEQPGWKMPYVNLTSSIECVDDSASKFYNQIIDRSTVTPDWNSSEQMLRPDDLYRWGVLVEHNSTPAQAGAGSCIFMHIWRGPGQPTVGCTAMPQADLESLIGWLNPARTPLLVQLPIAEYDKLRKIWRWPALRNASENGKH